MLATSELFKYTFHTLQIKIENFTSFLTFKKIAFILKFLYFTFFFLKRVLFVFGIKIFKQNLFLGTVFSRMSHIKILNS